MLMKLTIDKRKITTIIQVTQLLSNSNLNIITINYHIFSNIKVFQK